MLGRLRSSFLISGPVLLGVCGLGLTIYNGRWYSTGSIKSWGREWSGVHERAVDSAAAGAAFGFLCFTASIVGLVLFMIDFNRTITVICFLVSLCMFFIEMIPELIILCGCKTFSSENNLWVHFDERVYYNTSSEYRDWVHDFWPEQINYGGVYSKSVMGMEMQLTSIGGTFSKLPVTWFWNPIGSYNTVTVYNDSVQATSNTYSCIIDFNEGQTVHDYRSASDSSVCSSMKVTAVKCIGRWSESALLSELTRACEEHWSRVNRESDVSSGEAYSAARVETAKLATKKMVREDLPSMYLVNCMFFGLQSFAVALVSAGVVLSFVIPDTD